MYHDLVLVYNDLVLVYNDLVLVYNDLVLVDNVLHGHVNVSENNFIFCNNPVINTTISTRGHGFKLKTAPFKIDITKPIFCNRVLSTWNIQPERIVNLTSKIQFKTALHTANFECAAQFDR